MADMVDALDAFDRVVAASRDLISSQSSDHAAARVAELRTRRGFQGEVLVVAFAGGTGTGKSSLLNALAGARVASVSPLRPHTDRPLAWVPETRGAGIDDFLAGLGIVDVISQRSRPGLALIDLPDMDSVALSHREVVDRLIPAVDLVTWVFDPVKYRDPAVLAGFLEPLTEYRDHFAFVLNKIDLAVGDGRALIVEDIRAALGEVGYPDPLLFMAAAAPSMGAQEGIAALDAHLVARTTAKRAATSKWLIDMGVELRRIATDAGLWDGASLDFRQRWDRDRDAAVAGALGSAGAVGRSDGVCRVEDLIAMIAVEVGSRTGEPIRSRFPEGTVEAVLDEATVAAAAARAATKRKRRASEAATAAATMVVDREIGAPLQTLLSDRARFGALVADAAVVLAQARAALGATPDVSTSGA